MFTVTGLGPQCECVQGPCAPGGSKRSLIESLPDRCALRWLPPLWLWNDRVALWAAAEGTGWEMRLCNSSVAVEAAVLDGTLP